MRMLVTGAGGQVGTELARELAPMGEVLARDRAALDLARHDELVARVRELRPDVIVNAAAYTAVDRAESEPAAARAVNAVAPGLLAEEAKRLGALLIHYSTDYVFDGAKAGPYVEDDPTGPLGVYGLTKLEGEQAIAAAGCDHLILRTSWVYGPHGRNFMLTMLKLAGREELRIVDDQHGAPTSSRQLARLTAELLRRGLPRLREARGTYHATAAGETTWFGFAQAIFAERARTAPGFVGPRLVPIPASEYPTPARRPRNSVLSNERLLQAFGTRMGDWRQGLAEALSAVPG